MANPVLKLGHKGVNAVLKKFNQVSCGVMMALDKKRQNFVFENEYIRASSLELIANEVYDKNIMGSVAELGVYRGDFAKIINIAFPDRKLYLFDTFEGFDERDVKIEKENGFSMGNQDFSGTSVELVLSKMKHRENCIIKKGYFPESINDGGGINDFFSFVSIDVDLYEPMYKGLHYFYDKLNYGGYIMLHDYNNKGYSGVKIALRNFSKKRNIPYFPLCDSWGSAIIMKIQ
ncbi:MAG: TylF/MycF family methyltransferase [Tannerella sp.]|jgi:O-methyltransferase|nr:TylF/MycF family methyltransferase [Tannerella sp.]